MNAKDLMRELHELECWDRLASHEFGRLAYHLIDEVHIVPINYAVADRQLVFRTTEGSKLLGVVMHEDVAFEIDEIDEETAWSVVARGRARILDGAELRWAEQVPLRPWVDEPKVAAVAIEVSEVSGREYQLHRPWLKLRTD